MKSKLLNRSLLFLLPVIFIIQAFIVGYVAWKVRSDVIRDAEVTFTLAANHASVEIASLLDSSLSSVQAIAHAIEGMDRKASGSRSNVAGMLYKFLELTPDVLCCWVVFEQNLFDGRDFQFINRDGYGRTGRFYISFARKNAQVARMHDLKEVVFTDDISDIWGFNPFKYPGSFLTEPIKFSYTGIKTDLWFVTSLGHPISVDGERIGVVGLDINLKDMRQMVSGIRLSEKDYPVLLSNTGVIIYHPDPSFIGKNLDDMDDSAIIDKERIMNIVRNGETASFRFFDKVNLKEDAYRVFAPINVRGTTTPWSIMITVPVSAITKDADIITRNIIIASLAGIMLLAVLISLHVRGILRPVDGIYKILHNMSQLEFRLDPSVNWIEQYRGDEISDIVLMLNDIREKLCTLISNLAQESKLLSGSARKLASLASSEANNVRTMMDRIKGANSISQLNSALLEESAAIAQDVAAGIATSAHAASDGAAAASAVNSSSALAISHVKSVGEGIISVRNFSAENLKDISRIGDSVSSIIVFADTAKDIAEEASQLVLDVIEDRKTSGEQADVSFTAAGEVIKLSQDSIKIAEKTKSLAEELKTNINFSVSRMLKESAALEQMASASSEAMDGLDSTLTDISRICSFIQSIAASAEEGAASSEEMSAGIDRVAAGISEVAENINGISVEADKTAISARHVAMKSERLDELSLRLQAMIENFKVDDSWEKFKEENMHRKMSCGPK